MSSTRPDDERGAMARTDTVTPEGTTQDGTSTVRVLLYSDNVTTRRAVLGAAGERVAEDLPPLEWHEVATGPAVIDAVDHQSWDLVILDGEAGKTGGMGLARQIRDEFPDCPPICLLIARPQDAWLGSWSEADQVVTMPLDPFDFAKMIADMLRGSAA
jgi:CheY-like chemotaxis protein